MLKNPTTAHPFYWSAFTTTEYEQFTRPTLSNQTTILSKGEILLQIQKNDYLSRIKIANKINVAFSIRTFVYFQ